MGRTRDFVLCLALVAQVLAVTRPPGIFMQPDYDVYYKAGETVEMPCVAEGSPRPVYTWKRNGIDFNPSGNDDRVVQLANVGTIVITKPEDKDEGIFQCFAENSYGKSLSININLREAKLKDFEVEADRHVYPQLGQPLTLNCVPPESIPPANVFWVIKKPYGGFDAVNYDARVSMDHEYRLRFTNVKRSDEMGGRAYACMSMNGIMRKSTQGPQFFIHPQGGTEELRPVSYMWASPEDHFGLRGSNFTVKCIFAGNPTPDVHWERTDGAPLPDRAQIRSFGQELMIENLQFDDAGNYECWATNTNTQTRVQRTVTVRVESRPYWLLEPQDVEIGVGGTAEFNCLARSVPEPQYFWYVNGVPLRDVTDPRITADRFKIPRPDRIVFSDLTREDPMVIQCNATNKHGYIWGDVFLNVLSKSTSTTPSAPTTSAAERHDVVCGATSITFSIPLPAGVTTSQGATLSDPTCRVDTGYHHLSGSTGLNSCGTTLRVTNDTLVFSNAILLSLADNSSTMAPIIPIECSYNRTSDISLSAYMPVVRQVLFTETGVGQFSFRIQQYRDATFGSRIADASYPLRLMPSEEVFMEIALGGQRQQPEGLGMDVMGCVASPSSSLAAAHSSGVYGNLIVNNCPASSEVQLHNDDNYGTSRNHSLFRFSFRAQTFPDPADPQRSRTGLVYIHCRVRLCRSSDCQAGARCPSAPGRSKRAVTGLSEGSAGQQLSTGPLLVETDSTDSGAASPIVIVLGVIAACATLVAMTVIVVWQRSRRRDDLHRLQKVSADDY